MRHGRERGAALMIVLLFAAILAITLYQAVPQAMFEARRAKEQLLIDRGHQYVRAIQLYYRKFRPQYPPSIKALEDTNHMRFLRHRFKDPFTGKDDWRLIHTNGIALTDSKVNPIKTTGKQSGSSSASGWFNSSSSAFGSSNDSFSDTSSSDEQPELVVPPVRKRPPEIPANEGSAQTADSTNQYGGDLNAQLQTDLASEPSLLGAEGQAAVQPASAADDTNRSSAPPTGSQNPPNPMQMVRNMLSNEAPRTPQQPNMGPGAMHGPGIAGVASRAAGKSIKLINDQDDYSLWEFVYDPTKDRTGTPAMAGRAPAGANAPVGSTTTAPE